MNDHPQAVRKLVHFGSPAETPASEGGPGGSAWTSPYRPTGLLGSRAPLARRVHTGRRSSHIVKREPRS